MEAVDIQFSDPKSAKAVVITALLNALGRMPTDAEVQQAVAALTRYV